MSRRITVTKDGACLVVRGWRAADLAREAGLRPVYSGVSRGWLLDVRRLSDLVAFLESRNVPVVIEDPEQLELLGGDA